MSLAVDHLLDDLEDQAVMFDGMAKASPKDPIKVGVFGAWASATRQCLSIVRASLPAIIDEAQLIPDPEPDREAVFRGFACDSGEGRERCPACGHHDGYHADDCDRPA